MLQKSIGDIQFEPCIKHLITFPVMADNLSTPLPPCKLDWAGCDDDNEEGFEKDVGDGVVGRFALAEFDWILPKC